MRKSRIWTRNITSTGKVFAVVFRHSLQQRLKNHAFMLPLQIFSDADQFNAVLFQLLLIGTTVVFITAIAVKFVNDHHIK